MKNKKLASFIVILAALAVAVLVLAGINPLAAIRPVSKNQVVPAPSGGSSGGIVATASVSGRSKPVVPSGEQIYQVAQAAEIWPKIIQADINPPDVHVGDVQKLSLVLQDNADIVSVEAVTRTDNSTTTVPLKLVGPTSPTSLLPQRYFVDGNHQLAFVTPDNSDVAKNTELGSTASAAEPPKYTYAGEWTVKDTHEAKYYTTFVVKDSAGKTNSITIAWLDPCTGFNAGGTGTLNNACTVSGVVDGVDNGNLVLNGNTLTLTGSGAVFVWNPGFSVTVGTGHIAIGANTQLVKGYLWMVDYDGDGYPASATQYWNTSAASSPVGNGRRRNLLNSNLTTDCYDSNASANPGIPGTSWFTTDRGDGSFDYNCNSGIDYEFSYSVNGSCTGVNDGPGTCGGGCGSVTCDLEVTGWMDSGSSPSCGQNSNIMQGSGYGCNGPSCSYGGISNLTQACH